MGNALQLSPSFSLVFFFLNIKGQTEERGKKETEREQGLQLASLQGEGEHSCFSCSQYKASFTWRKKVAPGEGRGLWKRRGVDKCKSGLYLNIMLV